MTDTPHVQPLNPVHICGVPLKKHLPTILQLLILQKLLNLWFLVALHNDMPSQLINRHLLLLQP